MYNGGASAYARTAKITQSPRELEASLLLRAAYRLQVVCDSWETSSADLAPALTFNRRIWTILSTSATAEDNPLPEPIKVSIAQLAGFIFQRTIDILIEPEGAKLGILVRINREIAAGLRASAANGQAVPAAAA